jgi:hypothetical protein
MKGIRNLCLNKNNKIKENLSKFNFIKYNQKNFFILNTSKLSKISNENFNNISNTQYISNVIR